MALSKYSLSKEVSTSLGRFQRGSLGRFQLCDSLKYGLSKEPERI